MSNYSNVAKTLYIRSAIANNTTAITVTNTPGGAAVTPSSYGWPSHTFYAQINADTEFSEVVKVTNISGTSVTIQRPTGQSWAYGSVAYAHVINSTIVPVFSADDIDNLVDKRSPTFPVRIVAPASTSGSASFKITPGIVPSSPEDGDMWQTGTGLFTRVNGVTKDISGNSQVSSDTVGNLLPANLASGTDTLSDTTGITIVAGTGFSDTSQKHLGSRSLRVTATGADMGISMFGGATSSTLATHNGKTVTVFAYVFAPSITKPVTLNVYYRNASNTLIATIPTTITPSAEWKIISLTTQAPDTAAFVSAKISVPTSVAGDVINFDTVSMHFGASGEWSLPGVPVTGTLPVVQNKGDLVVGSSSQKPATILPVDTAGKWLTTDPTTATGVKWAPLLGESVAANVVPMPHPAESLLKQAVWWIDAGHSSAKNQSIQNIGWGGSVLNAICGSGTGSDTNDPKYLGFEGTPYVYFTNVLGNNMTVPHGVEQNVTGDIDIRVQVAQDDWTPPTHDNFINKRASGVSDFAYQFSVSPTGNLSFYYTADGTTPVSVDSTVPTGFADGALMWVRVTRNATTGDVQFFTSVDGLSWNQLGGTVTTIPSAIWASSNPIYLGAAAAGNPMEGKYYRAQVLSGINGTPVLDVDTSVITSGAQTSFKALTGQTVTINRVTSGRKTVVVTHPLWLFGTNDCMQVPDHALLDFGSTGSFTLLAVFRQWANPTSTGRWMDKRGSAGAGVLLAPYSNTYKAYPYLHDGTNLANDTASGPSYAAGEEVVLTAVIDRSAQTLVQRVNMSSTSPALSISSVGSVSNDKPLVIGANSDITSFQDFEGVAFAVFRRALSAFEIQTITDYYKGRVA